MKRCFTIEQPEQPVELLISQYTIQHKISNHATYLLILAPLAMRISAVRICPKETASLSDAPLTLAQRGEWQLTKGLQSWQTEAFNSSGFVIAH